MNKSLFGELATRLSPHTENLATEALTYILSYSKAARQGMFNSLKRIAPIISDSIIYKTQIQSTDNLSIPDIIGTANNEIVFIGEAKFWAGLTDNQPVTYFNDLSSNTPSVLLFIAPESRKQTLWRELLERCRAYYPISGLEEACLTYKIELASNKHLAYISWTELLAALSHEAIIANDSHAISDIAQLKGLCDKMDREAFLPIQSHEISPHFARRIINFSDLIDGVIAIGKSKKIFSFENLRTSGNRVRYVAYFKFGPIGAGLAVDADKWNQLANTPIWLEIFGDWSKNQNNITDEVFKMLTTIKIDGITVFESSKHLSIPLKIKFDAEKDDVVLDLFNQVMSALTPLQELFPKNTSNK